jgi:hypothetical protein
MSAIIKNYQKHADECARLAKESDDPKLREMFLKMSDQWTQAVQRASHDPRGQNRRGTYTGVPPTGMPSP